MSWIQRWKFLKDWLESFMFGAALSWVMVPHTLKWRQEMERLFVMLSALRLLGVPLLPSSGELQLLPHFVPNLMYWRRMTIFDGELEGVDLRHLGH